MTNTWNYLIAAGQEIATSARPAEWRARVDALLVWHLNKTAADAAIEYSRLINENVAPEIAAMSVEMGAEYLMAMEAAADVLGVGYSKWSVDANFKKAFPNAKSDG
jgi:hypothetical protein